MQPANVAMPATAASGFAVHDNVPPAGVVNANVTGLVSVVTVLPPRSRTVTLGCVARATPPVDPLGCCVNASCAAGPTATTNEELTAEVRAPSVAVSD